MLEPEFATPLQRIAYATKETLPFVCESSWIGVKNFVGDGIADTKKQCLTCAGGGLHSLDTWVTALYKCLGSTYIPIVLCLLSLKQPAK